MKFVALLLSSLLIGICVYAFVFAEGHTYFSNDPKSCVNCHVMRNHFEAWQKSSHHAVAVCNDCHTPSGFVPKYFTKALNGWNHSVAFTSGMFKDPIQITSRNKRIADQSCRKCHQQVVHQIDTRFHGEELSCIRCHDTVGHME